MNKLISFFALSVCLFLFSGCNDNANPEISLTAEELQQTTWSVELFKYNEEGVAEHQESCIIQFFTDTEGWYVNEENSDASPSRSDFYYQVDKRQISFKSCALTGIWTITEKTNSRMTMYAYRPQEYKAVFTKKY